MIMSPKTERLVLWLDGTRRGRMAMWALERLAFILGALAAMWIIHEVEARYFPVIEGWQLEHASKEGDSYIVGGKLRKVRSCELLNTSIVAVPKIPLAPRVLIYQIKPEEILGGNAPKGDVTWGPWQVPIPKKFAENRDQIAYLEVVGAHRCHAFWAQETTYGNVPIERLPK